MTLHVPLSGGRAVGRLRDLDPVGRGAVRALRLWCDEGAPGLMQDFGAGLGPAHAEGLAATFDRLCRLCCAAAHRPMLRHARDCPCLGADEDCFATLLRCAAEGRREATLELALDLGRADAAPAIAGLAEQAALGLHRLFLRQSRIALH